jgi:hypothetical protein
MNAGFIRMGGRSVHGGGEIGPPLFYKILAQMGISHEEFRKLR